MGAQMGDGEGFFFTSGELPLTGDQKTALLLVDPSVFLHFPDPSEAKPPNLGIINDLTIPPEAWNANAPGNACRNRRLLAKARRRAA